jgi:site-specific DNA recombinase
VTFTTIGLRVTGTAVIQNELYAGRLVWSKVRMTKDPDTGKRMSRPNAKNEWQTTDVPDLRIVFQKLFDAKQSRKQAHGIPIRTISGGLRHMLSGLLRCGARTFLASGSRSIC